MKSMFRGKDLDDKRLDQIVQITYDEEWESTEEKRKEMTNEFKRRIERNKDLDRPLCSESIEGDVKTWGVVTQIS